MIAGIIVSFITAPLLLKYVGEERYGVYRVLFDIFSYFGILDVGIFGSMMMILNKSMAKMDVSDKWAAIIASKRIYYKITVVSVFVFLAFIPFLSYLVPVSDIPKREFYLAYLIMGIGIFFLSLKVNQAYLEAKQLGYLIGFGLTFQNVFYSVVAIGLGYIGFGLVGMAIGFAFGQLLPYFYYLYKFKKIVPPLEREITSEEIEQKRKDIWHIQWPVLLTSITGRLSIYSDTIIISKCMSPIAVSAFFISQRVVSIAGNFLMGISGATWAAMGELYNSGEDEKFRDLFFRISKFISVVSVIFAVPIIFLSKSFVTLWVGESLFVSDFFIFVAVVNMFVQSVLTFWGWCFTVTHKVHRLMKLQILSTILNIGTSIYFTLTYKHSGPILGTLFTYFTLFGWWIVWHLKDEFALSVRKIVLTFLPSLIYLLFVSYVGLHYYDFSIVKTWSALFMYGFLIGVTNLLLCNFLLFSKEEKQYFYNRIRSIF